MKKVFKDITSIRKKNIKITIHKESHRQTLIRWIYEVCMDFRYTFYTYLRTVMLVDRYIRTINATTDDYQLIGVSCLFICAKIEETTTRPIKSYELVTENSCKVEEILIKENEILEQMDYSLNYQLPLDFERQVHLKKIDKNAEIASELLKTIISALYEKYCSRESNYTIYTQALRISERIVKFKVIESPFDFYINNNPKLEALFNKKNQ
ncbi:CG21 [Hepatospora eriocheir]|uniref:CG21 n=1 Tax=Hepatospora eriocheir TaxID=1081669 RepID=A0A1X0QJL7_9MICR|nr:CG21 [Hepatospora eriocheir]